MAGQLVADPNVYPGKGVAIVVDAPWINHNYVCYKLFSTRDDVHVSTSGF